MSDGTRDGLFGGYFLPYLSASGLPTVLSITSSYSVQCQPSFVPFSGSIVEAFETGSDWTCFHQSWHAFNTRPRLLTNSSVSSMYCVGSSSSLHRGANEVTLP